MYTYINIIKFQGIWTQFIIYLFFFIKNYNIQLNYYL